MSVTISLISRRNIHLLDRIADDVFDGPIDGGRLQSYLADPAHQLFVAVLNGTVVGQAKTVLHRHPDKAPGIYVEELGVSPVAQRRGIARALMDAVTTLARNQGCAEIWLATEPDNAAGNAFYRAYGLSGQPVVMFNRLLNEND